MHFPLSRTIAEKLEKYCIGLWTIWSHKKGPESSICRNVVQFWKYESSWIAHFIGFIFTEQQIVEQETQKSIWKWVAFGKLISFIELKLT